MNNYRASVQTQESAQRCGSQASWLHVRICKAILCDFLLYLDNVQLQNGIRGTVLISVLPTKVLLRSGSLGHL